jgi:transposase
LTISCLTLLEKGMTEVKLRNDQWRKLREFLNENPKVYVGQERQCRRFIEGILWLTRSGAQWRLLPTRYGNWNSVCKRFDRWSERGIWSEMVEHFAGDPDMEKLMLDSSVIRAHSCSAGAPKEKGGKKRKHSATVAVVLAARFT